MDNDQSTPKNPGLRIAGDTNLTQNQPLPQQQSQESGGTAQSPTNPVTPSITPIPPEPDFLTPPTRQQPLYQPIQEPELQQPVDNSSQTQEVPTAEVQQTLPPLPSENSQTNSTEAKSLPQESPTPIERNTSSIVKKIVKILIGLFVVIFILGIIYFVYSKFFVAPSKINLSYWGLWEDNKVMQSTISDFERENPNIKVEYIRQDINDYRDRLITRIENGTGPDIFRFHNSWTTMLSSILLPIPTDTISKSEFTSDFYPVVSNDLIKNGAIYGVPLGIDTLALYVNSQSFQNAGLKPPTNWNEFIDASRALTVKDENGKIKTAGAAMGTFGNITHAPDIISLLFLQNSVDLRDLNTSKERISGALNFYSSFATDTDNVWDNTLDSSILAFAKGNLAMYFGYSWDYFTIKQFNPNLNFQIVPVPQLASQNVSLASYWVEGVSLKTKHQKEALLFIKFLSRKETEQKLYSQESQLRLFGEPYARVDLADSLKDNPNAFTFVQQAKNASSSYFIDQTSDNALNEGANRYLENAVNSILNGTSAESAFDTFEKGVTSVLDKYGW